MTNAGSREIASPIASTRKRALSLTQKLIALMVATVGTIVVFLAIYFPSQQIRASRAALDLKAETYGRLVSQQVRSAVAFDDHETAREVFDAVAEDADVRSLVLLGQDGRAIHMHGAPGHWLDSIKQGVTEQRVFDLGDRIVVIAPVVAAEGPRGTLAIELSTLALAKARSEVTRTAAIVGALALAVGALLAFFIARSLGRRVGAIAQVASAVAGGDLAQQPVHDTGGDEIATLADAFNAMLLRIQSLVTQIQESAQQEQDRLEGLVRARTAELHRRNSAMRLVLDNVEQGLFTVDLAGRMSQESSTIVERWFGSVPEGRDFFDYIERNFAGRGDWARIAWEGLREEWMPLELRIDQLPSELERDGHFYALSYKPIFEGEPSEIPREVLVVATDITVLTQQRRAEEEDRELVQIVRRLFSDRSGVEEFVKESDMLVASIAQPDIERSLCMRALHTLKGNSGIFGFGSLARLSHELENALLESPDGLAESDRQRLVTSWSRLKGRIDAIHGGRSLEVFDVSRSDYATVLDQLGWKARHSDIRALLESWQLEPTQHRLERAAEHIRALATRLEKEPLEVRIEANDVRLDPTQWTPFWQAYIHVVRNAVDHGLESRDERVSHGKPEEAVITLRTRRDAERLFIEVEDNGRGIDWTRVADAARKRGMPADTNNDLQRALFADGLSTRNEVSETSGRGVGLSVVRETCTSMGGEISISSAAGQGTCIQFSWPVDGRGTPLVLRSKVA